MSAKGHKRTKGPERFCPGRSDASFQRPSNATIVEIVITLDVHLQEGFVATPFFIFRQLDFLLRVGVALALVHRLFYRRGEILQVSELIAHVIFVSGLPPTRARMAGN